MTIFHIYVYFLVLLKTLFILGAIYLAYLKNTSGDKETIEKIEYWKQRCEFVFVIGVAVILIITFTPWRSKVFIDYETRLLLFMLGWILLITAKWTDFFHQAKWFGEFQKIIGRT
jgi:hypothetical protein